MLVVLDIATVERTVAIAMDKGRYGEVGGGSRCFRETVDSNLGCRKLCRCDLESILVNIFSLHRILSALSVKIRCRCQELRSV